MIRAADVRKVVAAAQATTGIVEWGQRWRGSYYSGATRRTFPTQHGYREVMRRIQNERADRRATGCVAVAEYVEVAEHWID